MRLARIRWIRSWERSAGGWPGPPIPRGSPGSQVTLQSRTAPCQAQTSPNCPAPAPEPGRSPWLWHKVPVPLGRHLRAVCGDGAAGVHEPLTSAAGTAGGTTRHTARLVGVPSQPRVDKRRRVSQKAAPASEFGTGSFMTLEPYVGESGREVTLQARRGGSEFTACPAGHEPTDDELLDRCRAWPFRQRRARRRLRGASGAVSADWSGRASGATRTAPSPSRT